MDFGFWLLFFGEIGVAGNGWNAADEVTDVTDLKDVTDGLLKAILNLDKTRSLRASCGARC